MLPFYIFYSCFGFRRVADLIHAAADQRARGFLLGARAGRTTLSGEGLQHQDGASHLWASAVATCRAYDPCFGYELALILQDGMRRMLEAQEDIFCYVTVMNENYTHPPVPQGAEEGVLRGLYRVKGDGTGLVQLLGSGTILHECFAAAEILAREHGIPADVWSVTSWTEVRWDGMLADHGFASAAVREVRGNGSGGRNWVARCLEGTKGPIVAASDYVCAVADLIRPYIPAGRTYVTLGTDGFGRSDTRAALREFFGIDAHRIAETAGVALARDEASFVH